MNKTRNQNRAKPGALTRWNKTRFLSAFVILALSGPALADWSLSPVIRVGAEADDNPRLDPRTDQEVDLAGYLADLTANIAYNSARTDFSFSPRWLVRVYPDEPDFESNDTFFRSRFNYQMQSSSLGFWASYDEQQIRNAEQTSVDFDVEDPDEVDGVGTGESLLTGDRKRLRLVPRWSWNFSDVSSLRAQVNYIDVSYDDVFAGILTPYIDTRLALSYRRALSSRTTLVVMGTGRTFQADNPNVEDVNGVSGLLGFERAMSETTSLRAMVGVENTEQTAGEQTPEPIGDLTLTRRGETITMFAQIRRSVNASGAGQVTLRDQINVNFSRQLNEKILAGLGVRAFQTRNIGDLGSSLAEREFVQLRGMVTWNISRTFAMETSYQYTVVDRGPELDGRANSNRINLWFIWEPNPIGR